MNRIYHITLTTGDSRWSPDSEVTAETIAWLAQTVIHCEQFGVGTLITPDDDQHYEIHKLAPKQPSRHCAVWTMRRPQGPALVTIALAMQSRQGAGLWREIHAGHCEPANPLATEAGQPPPPPWLAVIPHIPLLLGEPSIVPWIGDFERCFAWAWVRTVYEVAR